MYTIYISIYALTVRERREEEEREKKEE